MNNVLIFPSFYSLVTTGVLLLVIFFMVIKHFNQLLQLDIYKKISLLCVIAIAIGNHGLLHALFEPNKPHIILRL